MSSRKKGQANQAARDAVTSSTPTAEPTHLLPAYMERRRRHDAHDTEQRHLRALRKSEGPSASERTLMTATADSYAGTRTDWHLDFVRLHSARRVDLRGTPEMDPRLINRLSTAERMAARQKHSLAVAFLEKHAPAQAAAYREAFTTKGSGTRVWEVLGAEATCGPQAIAGWLEEYVARYQDVALPVARHRLWAAVRHVLAACDGIVPEAVADYATARQGAIRRAERRERARQWAALQKVGG